MTKPKGDDRAYCAVGVHRPRRRRSDQNILYVVEVAAEPAPTP